MLLKLERDQARAVVDNFFPYVEMLCETKYQDAILERDQFAALNVLLIRSLVLEVHTSFKKKLLTAANNFTFKFSDAHGITVCSMFLQLPIQPTQVWLCNLRQLITDSLDKQIKNLV